jgi:hypothetical protein
MEARLCTTYNPKRDVSAQRNRRRLRSGKVVLAGLLEDGTAQVRVEGGAGSRH